VDPKDLHQNIEGGARYFRAMLDRFNGDVKRAVSAYNAGPQRVDSGKTLPKETQDYVPKLIAAALIAKQPDRFGFPEIERRDALSFDEVSIPDATDLSVIARCAGITVDEVKELNPELKRWATPPVDPGEEPYRLRLPQGTGAKFEEAFARLDPAERLTFSGHVVRRGDTLGTIAAKFGTTTDAIAQANGGLGSKKLKVGQELVIPVPAGAARSTGNAAARDTADQAPGRKVASVGPPPKSSERSGAEYHHLLPGETLGHLALRYGSSVEEIKRWNRIRDPKKLRAGQRLRVR
jgi:membrane-bound lytic murein transglycosylase D